MAKITALSAALACALAMPALAQDLALTAHEAAARGDLAAAITRMQAHIQAQPGDSAARKDLARYYLWTGDYAEADALLSPMAGTDAEAKSLLANTSAWAGKVDRALALNAEALAEQTPNFLAQFTQAVALRQTAQAGRAWPYVEAAERMQPEGKDVKDLRRGTYVRTASDITLQWGLLDDSDDIRAERFALSANIRMDDDWYLLGGWSHTDYRAPIGGGYEPISGGDSIADRQFWLGAAFTPAADTRITMAVGRSDSKAGDETTGLLRVDQRASDDFSFSVGFDRNRLGISPRSVSLGLMRDQWWLQARYTPGYHWTFDAAASFDDINDGNRRSDWQFAARRAILRNQTVQLDLGAEVQWLGFNNNPGNGYYAPDNYRRAALTASAYFPIGDDAGFYARAGVGMQRDESFSSWKSANDISVEWVTGIFSDWELRIQAGYSDRAQQTGLYDANRFGVQIKRRF